jgi:activator of Hsp90 ATPase-like protein
VRTQLVPIQRSVTVPLEPAEAFELFTARMESWWPVRTHSRAEREFEDEDVHVERIEFQGTVGGGVLEHMTDGRVLPWAEILVWEPPVRFVMAWKPNERAQPPTDVEVRFTPVDGGTLVELEHRGWERLTEAIAPELHASYAGGWIGTLSAFAAAAEEEVA